MDNKNKTFYLVNKLLFNDDSISDIVTEVVVVNQHNCNNINNAKILLLKSVRENHFRPEEYAERWVPAYLETDFFRMFRMTRSTFEKLLLLLGPQSKKKLHHGGNYPITLEKRLLITIWFLAKGETLRSIGDRYNVADSTATNCIEEIISIINSLISNFIKWPNSVECIEIAEHFKNAGGYPGVIGAIDGTHIACKVPEEQHTAYLNRKQHHSMLLQGICTSTYLFTNINVGFPGSAHDSRVLKNSTIYEAIENEGSDTYFYGQYHLLGDSAYFLRDWLITPYIDYGRLTAAQKKHNFIHSSTRVKIENTFGLLKSRWQILGFVNCYSVKKVVAIVTACCVLHNFTYINGDKWPDTVELEQSNEERCIQPRSTEEYQRGQRKRDNIKDILNNRP